jgi:NAD(P)-dependent dehydrogenase (short-subunit alcohol dehydrogenase family)
MSFEWKDRVVVITGASGGIGAALAHEVGRRGGSPVLAARRVPELEAVAKGVSTPCAVVQADVTRRADVEGILRAALERFGHVDVWVNNAGRAMTRMTLDLTDEDVDTVMRDNVKSVLYGMQAIVPHYKERGRGQIVNVSSMLGRVPFASVRSAYSAAKHAMTSLTENVRMDLAKDSPGIVVTCVLPGVVATDLGKNAIGGGADSRALPNPQPVGEVASIIADAIAAQKNGDVYTFPGALDRILKFFQDLEKA